MRILYMTQWFEPEPAFKGLGFAKGLRARGCDVRVVTGFPNYPAGKLYEGYRLRPFQREHMDGIVVDRVPLYPSHSRSSLLRSLNYLSFAISLAIYGILALGRSDVIYAYHPPLTTALAAVIVGFFRRRPAIIDIQDLWPDTLAATGMMRGKRTIGLVDRVCGFVYARAARIIVQSPGFKRTLVQRGVPADKIEVILNWAQEDASMPRGKLNLAPFALDQRFNVVFAGTMGLAQRLDVVLDAARRIAPEEPRVQFVLVGDGLEAASLQQRIAAEAIHNVRMLPRVRLADIADVLAAADVLLVTLAAEPLFELTIPSKTQFYLCAGKPILMAARGDAALLIEQAGAGLVVPPGNAAALAGAVLALARTSPAELETMGRRGRAYYAAELSFASGIDRTISALQAGRDHYRARPS